MKRFLPTKHGFPGGSLVGHVTTTYDRLVAAFGEPIPYPDGKSHVEWHVVDTETGVVYAIYDYSMDEVTLEGLKQGPFVWHVGSLSRKANPATLGAFIRDVSECRAQAL